MLRMEHLNNRELAKKKKKLTDKYFSSQLFCHHSDRFLLSKSYADIIEADLEETKKQMHEDGYSWAEIGRLNHEVWQNAYEDEIEWKRRKTEEGKKKEQESWDEQSKLENPSRYTVTLPDGTEIPPKERVCD